MDFDCLTAFSRPGDIIKLGRHFALVISKDRQNQASGFYYTICDFDGNPIKQYGDRVSAANYVWHSNMILVGDYRDKCEIVNSRDMEARIVFFNCSVYQWYLTGDRSIDAYMSNLDARWSLFSDAASPDFLAEYARLEDRNYHSENADQVNAFCTQFETFKRIQARKMRKSLKAVSRE